MNVLGIGLQIRVFSMHYTFCVLVGNMLVACGITNLASSVAGFGACCSTVTLSTSRQLWKTLCGSLKKLSFTSREYSRSIDLSGILDEAA